jgi:BICD family-like cargo adapter
MENTNSSSQTPDTNTEIKFNRGMLSATADELVHIIMNLDAIQFKTMFDQTRSVLIDQEEELKKRQEKIMELESKVKIKFGNKV